jgi:DNA invertase Pin-like site-specific DNA recombinase
MVEQIRRVAIYARVSTEGQNVDLQLAELSDFIARRRWRLVGEYVDRGVSGSQESRPALNRLMNDAKQRKLDVIGVWKLDQFARSVKHVVVALSESEALGIAFVSLKDNLDLTTPSGRFMFQIIAAFGELERALIAERVRAGLQNTKKRGKRPASGCRGRGTHRVSALLRSLVAANLCAVGDQGQDDSESRAGVWHNPIGKRRCNCLAVSKPFRRSWCG